MKFPYRKHLLPAVALVAALVLAGCGRGSAGSDTVPGITDTTVSLGMTTPLSGPLANPGAQGFAGLKTYLDAANAKGGITFGDGKTRKVDIKSYDDAYDPAKAVANIRQEIAENQFANVGTVGTANSLAAMPVANSSKFPSVLIQSGSDKLSNSQDKNPWSVGFLPTYSGETASFGRYLAGLGKPMTVAVLQQNDDAGKAWLEGLQEGIKGSPVRIVEIATFETSDPTVDGQMAKLAATNADVLFEANGQLNIIPQSMLKAQQLGWKPSLFVPSVASAASQSITPGNGAGFAAVYTAAFSKDPRAAQFATAPDVVQFNADLHKHAPAPIAAAPTGQAVWGYQIGAALEAAFKAMKQPTREAFMSALHSLKGTQLPLLLDGVVFDATRTTTSPLTADVKVQKYDFGQRTYVTSES